MNGEKRSRATLWSLTFNQLMTWLPDGKICSAHKSCLMKKRTGLQKRGMREVFMKTAEWMHVTFLYPISFLPSLLHPFPSHLFVLSFVLLSSLFLQPYLWSILPTSLFQTSEREKCGSSYFSCLEEAPWILCSGLYVLVKYITVGGFQVIWCSEGECRGWRQSQPDSV